MVGQPREVSSFVSGDAVNVAPFRLPAATSLLLLLRCAFRRQEAAPPDPVERLPKLSVAGSIPVVRFTDLES